MSKTSRKKYLLIVLGLIVIIVLLNIVPGLSNGLGNFVFKVFSPIQKFFIDLGNRVYSVFSILFSIRDLAKENIALREEVLMLESKVAELSEVKRENRVLREGIDLSEKENLLIIQKASVVGKDIQGLDDWILIDKGSCSGLVKDMAVVSVEMGLVGRIIEVMENFSKIMLITNKESIVAALVEKNRVEGVVKESEKSRLFVDFIPRGEVLVEGDNLITSGMDNIFPKGILIGKIEEIDFSQNQLFQKIYINPVVNFSKLEEVFIVE
ncbi:MAG: rod shape-determining protein MreC [Candidatus Portnoybacteria bacterium]|nr:rod shape-determining protein MreC [Candidatus Portnoybacteria bacterium]